MVKIVCDRCGAELASDTNRLSTDLLSFSYEKEVNIVAIAEKGKDRLRQLLVLCDRCFLQSKKFMTGESV